MTIQKATEYFAALAPGFAGAEAVRAAAFAGRESRVRYIGVSGTAGKTTTAEMIASILWAAGQHAGLYTCGAEILPNRILIDGQPAEALLCAAAETMAAKPALPRMEAELAAACRCFEEADCTLAVVELGDGTLAEALPEMPACAVTAIGPDGSGHSPERLAHFAAGVMRGYSVCVTAPGQPKEALSEIIVTAGKTGCELIVPDQEDITFLEAEALANHVDYGGYEMSLPCLGRAAAGCAAVAVELSLALWRKGVDLPDEAILAGLRGLKGRNGVHVLRQRPLLLADPCRTPQQVQALMQVLGTAGAKRLSAVVGLTSAQGAEEFFAALESGTVPEKKTKKKQELPGMADSLFERVYLAAPQGTDPALQEKLAETAKYHFDTQVCADLAEALEKAAKDKSRGTVLCGSAEIVAEAKSLL